MFDEVWEAGRKREIEEDETSTERRFKGYRVFLCGIARIVIFAVTTLATFYSCNVSTRFTLDNATFTVDIAFITIYNITERQIDLFVLSFFGCSSDFTHCCKDHETLKDCEGNHHHGSNNELLHRIDVLSFGHGVVDDQLINIEC